MSRSLSSARRRALRAPLAPLAVVLVVLSCSSAVAVGRAERSLAVQGIVEKISPYVRRLAPQLERARISSQLALTPGSHRLQLGATSLDARVQPGTTASMDVRVGGDRQVEVEMSYSKPLEIPHAARTARAFLPRGGLEHKLLSWLPRAADPTAKLTGMKLSYRMGDRSITVTPEISGGLGKLTAAFNRGVTVDLAGLATPDTLTSALPLFGGRLSGKMEVELANALRIDGNLEADITGRGANDTLAKGQLSVSNKDGRRLATVEAQALPELLPLLEGMLSSPAP